ncbi:MAG: S16 family serine protease [Candidatus Micrarchaeia archaeon]
MSRRDLNNKKNIRGENIKNNKYIFKLSTIILTVLFFSILILPIHLNYAESTIYAPAVIVYNNTGILTSITLQVSPGNGNVSIKGPYSIGNSTLQSAITGAKYAASYLNINFNKYNFSYYINGNNINVSGPSGGAALTLLAISALSEKPLNNNFTITGTISSTGNIGPIGGVYDKVAAAKAYNLSYVLVPAYSGDDELYYLIEHTFNIPVIAVSNISQAYLFAFGKPSPTEIADNSINYTFYTKLNMNIRNAPYLCTGSCNYSAFSKLINFTFAMTNESIVQLSQNPSFENAAAQLGASMQQNSELAQKGYLYASADLAFLNFIDSNYLVHATNSSRSFGEIYLEKVNNACNLTIPTLNSNNYEYVIGGELRQSWGALTISSLLSSYNQTDTTSDGVLDNIKLAGTAYAWCNAASQMYNIASTINGTPIKPNQALEALANERIQNAEKYGNNTYLISAKDAFAASNYPLAIFGADYAYAMSVAPTSTSSTNINSIINQTIKLASNSTYGIWPTEFADESYLYAQEAKLASNSSDALDFAVNGYTTALLASRLSNDTKLIIENMTNGTFVQKISIPSEIQTTKPISTTNTSNQSKNIIITGEVVPPIYPYMLNMMNSIYDTLIVLLVFNVVFLVVIVALLVKIKALQEKQAKNNPISKKVAKHIKR